MKYLQNATNRNLCELYVVYISLTDTLILILILILILANAT